MNCKTILATKTILFSGTVLRITLLICFIGACSLAHAANVTWSGQLDVIEEDRGGAIYSGVALGTDFSGAISDVTFNGFITDGTTRTSFSRRTGEDSLGVVNDFPLEAEDAALINSLAGTSFIAGDPIDLIFLGGDADTAGGGSILISLTFVFAADVFNDYNNLDNYPPNLDDVLITFFSIEEENDQFEMIYSAIGGVDEIMFSEDVFQINAAISDAWFFPPTSGQGFFIIIWEDRKEVFLSWFTYDTQRPPEDVTAILGEPGHRWLTALGPYEGDTALLEVFLSSGMVLDSAVPPVTTDQLEGATIEIVWTGCNEGLVKYNIPSLGLSGEIPIERIVLDNVAACEAAQSPDINGSALRLVSPYVNENEIVRVDAFSFNEDSVMGRRHRGLDFFPNANLSEFQAACSGEVDTIALFKPGDYWQVNISVLCDERYSIGYAFEPMGVQQDGETQLDNIAVSIGQTVSQGDIIGRLHWADKESAHVHFNLWEDSEMVCPEQFFTSEARESILRLIHKDNPDWNMCNY